MNIKEKPFIATALPMGVGSHARELIVSCCLNINKYFEGFSTETSADIPKQYGNFYQRLQGLRESLNGARASLKIKVGTTTATMTTVLDVPAQAPMMDFPFLFVPSEEGRQLRLQDYADLRDGLWKRIFPAEFLTAVTTPGRNQKELNQDSRVPDPRVGSLVQMTDELPNLMGFVTQLAAEKGLRLSLPGTALPSLPIDKKLEAMQEMGRASEKRALAEKLTFIKNYFPPDRIQEISRLASGGSGRELLTKLANDIGAASEIATAEYLSVSQKKIDIDEVIHSFSALSNEPILMRLMGLIRDFEITLPAGFVPVGASPSSFYLSFELGSNADTSTIPTRIKGIQNGGKYAYLVAESVDAAVSKFYSNSILKVRTDRPSSSPGDPWLSHLYQFDKVAQELRIKATNEARETNSGALGEDPNDSFTRGIIFGNTGLAELVAPAQYPVDSATGYVPDDFAFSEDFVAHGQRVGAVINGNYHSLTGRRLELQRLEPDDDRPFFVSDGHEGCIHFDAVSNYIQDGELKSGVVDSLFEYSGELLGLKSAFSRAVRVSEVEQIMRAASVNDDGGFFKSSDRVKRIIDFKYFPEQPGTDETSPGCHPKQSGGRRNPLLGCYYDLPRHFAPGRAPQLRFFNRLKPHTYTFVVYQEYLNGWALPLEAQSGLQLSVRDLTNGNSTYLPPAIRFNPLESKKPVLLIHTRNVDNSENQQPQAAEAATQPLAATPIEREALETLTVWSDDVDSRAHACSRHVLPARIAFEHAFWYDLTSQMDTDQSFDWKRKYNCPFVDQKQYDAYVKVQPCPENGCGSYCGGTSMPEFSTDEHLVPNHLSDPSVAGFSVSFFRDKDRSIPINIKSLKAKFGGKAGLAPLSYFVNVDGSREELTFDVSDLGKSVDIRLKKGLQIWADIKNEISPDFEHHLQCAWYQDLQHLYDGRIGSLIPDEASKNPPRTIRLIHAVKKPIVKPAIKVISSTPVERYKYSHLIDRDKDPDSEKRSSWLEREYPGLTLESNVIVKRSTMHDAADELKSSIVSVNLGARFERLDAYLEAGQVKFVPNEPPTGGLELWMHKEEYEDNPEQLVLSPDFQSGNSVNHLPDQPILSFDSNKNQPHPDYRIEFNSEVMDQLKSRPVIVGDPDGDIFREITSNLELKFDAKSTRFEERRYQLRNTSLFKGHFTTKENENDKDYSRVSDEWRVLFLNNSRPEKPQVSHAITTISEVRTKHGEDDYSVTHTQKGNIVTIYLKRGRLSSGKNERVGVIVYNEKSPYHKAFKDADYISKAGRDIVTDNNTPTLSPFIRFSPDRSEEQDIVIPTENDFDARFDETLSIVSYLPKFDIEKQLWKFEVELNIKNKQGFQLHNPFVLFSLVHFQPFSVNYNAQSTTSTSTLEDIERDFRISAVEPFIWCYLLPERSLSVSFDKPGVWGLGSFTDFLDRWGDVDMRISFDGDSLHHFEAKDKWILRSNFLLSVEGSNDKISWSAVMSRNEETGTWSLMHPLVNPGTLTPGRNESRLKLKFARNSNPDAAASQAIKSQSFSHFRVRLVEVEWFSEESWEEVQTRNARLLDSEIVENEEMRVRYVELVY